LPDITLYLEVLIELLRPFFGGAGVMAARSAEEGLRMGVVNRQEAILKAQRLGLHMQDMETPKSGAEC
jgi:hypothetical protein